MSRTAVVGNYAEALLELATRRGEEEGYADWLGGLAASYRHEKKASVREALGEDAPEPFVRFVLVMLDKGRQRLLPEVAERYGELLDERRGRIHATISMAREPGEELREEISRTLSDVVGQEVVPRFRTDEDLLGGFVVRMGDEVMDGSLRRRLADLKGRLLRAEADREATRS